MSDENAVEAGNVSPPDQEQASLALIALVSGGMSLKDARAKLAGNTPTPEAVKAGIKPVEPEAEEVIEIAKLSDAELAEYYEEATGKKPHHLMKRETIEGAVREALT